ncbi:MAG: 50S ribosomal protein L21 [Anaerolineales bacterium]|jgi:large subunit ribosomal protein L21
MKYAVVTMGDKQYIAREGESIEIDRQSKAVGDDITFDEVLLVVNDGDVQVGDPTLKGITVTGTVEAQIKGPKILVFKYIPKERYRRRRGHRQRYTRVKIDSIAGDGKKKAAAAEDKPKAKSTRSKKSAAKPKAKSSSSSKSSTKKSTAKKPTTKKSTTKKSSSSAKTEKKE